MKKQSHLKSIQWAVFFAVGFPLSVFVLTQITLSLPVAILLITFNTGLLAMYAWRLVQSIQTMDEMQIRVQLESVSFAFILALISVMVLGLMELVDGLKDFHLSYLYVFPLLFLYYILGLVITNYRYR